MRLKKLGWFALGFVVGVVVQTEVVIHSIKVDPDAWSRDVLAAQ